MEETEIFKDFAKSLPIEGFLNWIEKNYKRYNYKQLVECADLETEFAKPRLLELAEKRKFDIFKIWSGKHTL